MGRVRGGGIGVQLGRWLGGLGTAWGQVGWGRAGGGWAGAGLARFWGRRRVGAGLDDAGARLEADVRKAGLAGGVAAGGLSGAGGLSWTAAGLRETATRLGETAARLRKTATRLRGTAAGLRKTAAGLRKTAAGLRETAVAFVAA
jgi:hypothetical protein